jgi:hypothetical protein
MVDDDALLRCLSGSPLPRAISLVSCPLHLADELWEKRHTLSPCPGLSSFFCPERGCGRGGVNTRRRLSMCLSLSSWPGLEWKGDA